MDKQTREYMNERVKKYDDISRQIEAYERTASECANAPITDTPQLYIKGNYRQIPRSILPQVANLISQKIKELETERGEI